MLKKILYFIVSLLCLITVVKAVAQDNYSVSQQSNSLSPQDVQRFGQAVQAVKNFYVEPVPDQKLFNAAIRGMLENLDPHSDFLDEEDLKDLRTATEGQFGGLGIEVLPEKDAIKVVAPLDGTPAQKAGIKPGDLILIIDKVPVKGLLFREAVKKMRGAPGTKVTLTILHQGENKPIQLTLTREIIHVESVKGKLLAPGIAYIRISNFQADTSKNLKNTIAKLTKASGGKLKGLLLDLRNNPGGLLDSAMEVADEFLEPSEKYNNLSVYTKGRVSGAEIKGALTPGDLLEGKPIVVLVNTGSASGAEIVAGALQDYKRAVILGEKSFGKGSVQTVIPLDTTTALKLTTALYYTPAGRSIQAKGIVPDVTVKDLKVSEREKAFESVKEASFEHHLHNGNGPVTSEQTEGGNSPPIAEDDFQLSSALSVLQALIAAGK